MMSTSLPGPNSGTISTSHTIIKKHENEGFQTALIFQNLKKANHTPINMLQELHKEDGSSVFLATTPNILC